MSDRTVRAVLAEGASDLAEVGARTGAGLHCGGCREAIEDLLGAVAHRALAAAS